MHKTVMTTPPNQFSKLPSKTKICKTNFFAQKIKTLRKQNKIHHHRRRYGNG